MQSKGTGNSILVFRARSLRCVCDGAAEIERDLISQRTTEALAARKQQGMPLGCPKGIDKSKLDVHQAEISALLKHGVTNTWITQKYGTTRRNLSHWIQQHGRVSAVPPFPDDLKRCIGVSAFSPPHHSKQQQHCMVFYFLNNRWVSVEISNTSMNTPITPSTTDHPA